MSKCEQIFAGTKKELSVYISSILGTRCLCLLKRHIHIVLWFPEEYCLTVCTFGDVLSLVVDDQGKPRPEPWKNTSIFWISSIFRALKILKAFGKLIRWKMWVICSVFRHQKENNIRPSGKKLYFSRQWNCGLSADRRCGLRIKPAVSISLHDKYVVWRWGVLWYFEEMQMEISKWK